jgi:F-type H+-transporting ATPase subunit delta
MPEQIIVHKMAGEGAILARRYANALYELAEEKKQLDAAAADLRVFRTLVKDNVEYHHLIRNPRLTRAQLVTAMENITKTAKLGTLAGSFLSLVAHKRRLGHLEDMINAFLIELARRRGEHTVEVRTAQPLTSAQKEKLTGEMEKLTGGTVNLYVKDDASLLGGLMVKIGSRLIDASIQGKLARLERQLKSQQEAA